MSATASSPLSNPAAIARVAGFRRRRTVANLLMLLMAVTFLLSWRWRAAHPALPYLKAFAEAALIGGLADWFAVVALFRRPLGLPIPHTAIIPRNKQRIGRGFGDFVSWHLLEADTLTALLRRLAVPAQLGDWLAQPANANQVAAALLQQIRRIGHFARGTQWPAPVLAALETLPLTTLLAETVSRVALAGLHRPWLAASLTALAEFVDQRRPDLKRVVGARTARWIPGWIDERLADRLSDEVLALLRELQSPTHPWRTELDSTLANLPARLADHPDWQQAGVLAQRALLQDPALRNALLAMAKRGLKRLQTAELADLLGRAGRQLADQPAWQATAEDWLIRIAAPLLLPRRQAISDFIAGLIGGWDDRTLVARLETEVGADLQSIRINGTLVGGLVGLLLFALTQWLEAP